MKHFATHLLPSIAATRRFQAQARAGEWRASAGPLSISIGTPGLFWLASKLRPNSAAAAAMGGAQYPYSTS